MHLEVILKQLRKIYLNKNWKNTFALNFYMKVS